MNIEAAIEKDNIHHGFAVASGEMENFMNFASQRGKCSKMNCVSATIKRNLLIISKNISATAQFFERQSKWLDQLDTEEEIDSDLCCEACLKH